MEKIGSLVGIYISKHAGGAMERLEVAQVSENGIVGDRYEQDDGFWQMADQKLPPEKPRKNRGGSAISDEDISKGNLLYGTSIEAIDTRRNFEFSGIPNLQDTLMSQTVQIGEQVQIEWSHDCDSCKRPTPGFEKFGKLGGVRGRVVQTGEVKVGDDIFKL